MIDDIAVRAEKHLLDDRGPFFVLRCYLEPSEYRKEIDAVCASMGKARYGVASKLPLPVGSVFNGRPFECAIDSGASARAFNFKHQGGMVYGKTG
jgi:hypothetical protein